MELKIGASTGLGGSVVITTVGHVSSERLNNAQFRPAFVARRVTCNVMYETSGMGVERDGVIVRLDCC